MLHNQHVIVALFAAREKNLVDYTRWQYFNYSTYEFRAHRISKKIDRELYGPH